MLVNSTSEADIFYFIGAVNHGFMNEKIAALGFN